MAAIGNSPTQQAFTPAIDYFSGNGSTTAFTLSRPVASVAQVQVVVNNVAQNPSSAYTVSSNTITFTSAPSSGTNNIYVYYTSPITQVIAPSQGTVGTTQIASSLLVPEANGGTGTTTGYYEFKNRIINGACVIDQRNSGASVTPTTNNTYTLDRFNTELTQASKFSVQQNAGSVTPPAGFVKYLGVTSLSAYSVVSGDYFDINQRIEGYNIADLNWGTANASTVTLSFWVRSSLTGTFGGSLVNDSANRSYPFSYIINSANTWEQKVITVVGETTGTWLTTNGIGINLRFGLGIGSSYSGPANAWASTNYVSPTGATSVVGTNGATWYITGVQLEKGSNATSFDYRDIGRENILCYRYFYKTNPENASRSGNAWGSMYATTSACLQGLFPVTMRTAPTVTRGGTNNTFYISGINAASSGTDQNYGIATTTYSFEVVSLSGGAVGFPVEYNGQLSWSAEL